MKKVLLFCFIFLSASAFAQSTSIDIDERLLSVYSSEDLEQMDVDKVDFLSYYVTNSYWVETTVESKYESMDLPIVAIEDIDLVNVFELPRFNADADENAYFQYKVEGSLDILYVMSMARVKKIFFEEDKK